jgi:hypothetical protein
LTARSAGGRFAMPQQYRNRTVRMTVYDIRGKKMGAADVAAHAVDIPKTFGVSEGEYFVSLSDVDER